MYDTCSYHILDYLVPPSANEDYIIRDSFLRLENICACAIVKDQRNENTLSTIPSHLHKILWKAYLLEKFYAYDFTFGAIPRLLDNWPHEEFNLKKLMPRLSPRLETFSPVWGFRDGYRIDPYSENMEHLDNFYFNITDDIIRYFFNFLTNGFTEQSKKELKIRRLNITGYDLRIEDICEIIKNKEPIFKKNISKLEIILDANVYMTDAFEDDSFFSNSLTPSLFKFNHVSLIASFGSMNSVIHLIKSFVNNGPISINLCGYVDASDTLENIHDSNILWSNVFSVTATNCVSSIKFLQFLNNLVHLNLEDNNMHGQLSSLKNMSKGLLYLDLSFCKLTNADLYHLIGSCHMITLRELNLSNNNFSYDGNSNNLIELCQELSNVLKLDIYKCNLGSWPTDEMSLLFNSMRNMPNIVYINLSSNAFSIANVHVHIMKLKKSISLRYLSLTLPSQVAESDANFFCEDINEMINKSRSQLLFVQISPDTYV